MILCSSDTTILAWQNGIHKTSDIGTYVAKTNNSDLLQSSISSIFASMRHTYVNGEKDELKRINQTLRSIFGKKVTKWLWKLAEAQANLSINHEMHPSQINLKAVIAYSKVLERHGFDVTREISAVVDMLATSNDSARNVQHLAEAEKIVTECSLLVNPNNRKTLVPASSVKKT